MDPELKDAVEGLYRVFERYPLRPWTEPCLCCHDPAEELVLRGHLLRDLSAGDLRGYAGDAVLVWGDEADFKHFLPRIMEITVTEGGSDWDREGWIDWPDTETIFSRLAYAKWREWPEAEQEAIECFLRAFWRAGLGRFPARDDIGTMLTAIALTEANLECFLDAWLEDPGDAPLRHLAEFAQTHATLVLMRHHPSNSYWGNGQRAAADGVASWIRGGHPRQRLVDGFFDAPDSAAEEELSNAVRVMEALEALPHAP